MRIGLLALSVDTGLGNQTREFYRHMKPAKTLVADMSAKKGMPAHHDWYPDARISDGFPTDVDCRWLVNEVDLIFVCETPLNYRLMEFARAAGVPIVLQYNYEFLEYMRQRLPAPAALAAPTSWHRSDVTRRRIAPVVDLPVPVDTDRIGRRTITTCRTVMHVAGRQAARDRNGTEAFIRACVAAGDRYRYVIYAQSLSDSNRLLVEQAQGSIDINVVWNVDHYEDIYRDGDLLVLPRKYGGLCLPMNEALAAGIPVVMPDIPPNADQLPAHWLTPATLGGRFSAKTPVHVYEPDVRNLTQKMVDFSDDSFMQASHQQALSIGERLSWKALAPVYHEVLRSVVESNGRRL